MRAADPTATVRALIAAIPNDRLVGLLLDLLARVLPARAAPAPAPEMPAPARRRRSWPRGKQRGPRETAKTKAAKREGADPKQDAAKRAAANAARRRRDARRRAAHAAAAGGNGAGASVAAFWEHASKLEPGRPWAAVTREFDVKEPVARNCYDQQRLPPQIGPMAVTRFLALTPS